MSVPISRDEEVQATADDALMSKLSSANMGYFHDPYLQYFVRKSSRRSPLINRGYYARVAAVAKIISDFVTSGNPDVPKQVVSLGAGYDSSYFRVKSSGKTFRKYFEVDFSDVCARKSGLIRKHEQLQEVINASQPYIAPPPPAASAAVASSSSTASSLKSSLLVSPADKGSSAALKIPSPSHPHSADSSSASSSHQDAASASHQRTPHQAPAAEPVIYHQGADYALLRADLRQTQQLEQHLLEAGIDFDLPTLFISECVLVYMKGEDSGRVIEWIPQRFRGGAVMMTYEQIRPDDAFGRTMIANLESRGCPLLGLRSHPSLEAQHDRFLSRGWTRARALDMNDVYRFLLPSDDVRRIERIELWDEFEEWNMIQAHYCIAMAQLDPVNTAVSAGSSAAEVESQQQSDDDSSSPSKRSSSSLSDADRELLKTSLLQVGFLSLDIPTAKQNLQQFKFMD